MPSSLRTLFQRSHFIGVQANVDLCPFKVKAETGDKLTIAKLTWASKGMVPSSLCSPVQALAAQVVKAAAGDLIVAARSVITGSLTIACKMQGEHVQADVKFDRSTMQRPAANL